MKKCLYLLSAIALLILPLSLISTPASAVTSLTTRITQFRQDFYGDPPTAWSAFETGAADIYGFGLTVDQIEDARYDPEIILAPLQESGMFEFDINNNITIPDYPDWRSPTSYAEFRKAIEHLVDKDTIIEKNLAGFADRLDVPLPAAMSGWFDPSGLEGYPRTYDPLTAAQILDAAGFVQGTTSNPYYDPDKPGSAEYIRVYPPGHEKEGEDLDPLIFYIRSDSPPRLDAGRMLTAELRAAGIPVDPIETTFMNVYGPVFTDKNYHLYTGGWGFGRFPTYLWFLYHSRWWIVGVASPNYVTGKYANGTAVHPEYDELLDKIWFAVTLADAAEGVQLSLEYHWLNAVNIPLWSLKGYWAYRKPLIGVVNMQMFGIDNGYTYLNIRKPGSDIVIMALVTPPVKLNPLYTSDYYGWQVLGNLYSGLMSVAPYKVARDQPWVAQDWSATTWVDPEDGRTKSKLTFWFRQDSYFSDGVQFTPWDYAFSMWYLYQFDDAWLWDAAMDIHHIDLKDLNGDGWLEAEVYMNELSFWLLYAPTFPLLPKHIWLTDPPLDPDGTPLATYEEETVTVTTPGIVPLTGDPVYVESVVADGTTLEQFTQWNLMLSPNPKGVLKILVDLGEVTVTVKYWAAGDPHGYTPGGWDATTILVGNGIFKLIELVPGKGGYALMEKNAYKTVEIPVGEINFWWHWKGTTKPRSGRYKIDIGDLGMMKRAWHTSGDGVDHETGEVTGDLPDPEWLTGADISDVPDSMGVIDLYDLATLSPNYKAEFGQP